MEFIDNVTPSSFAGYQGTYGKTSDNDFYKQNWKDWASMYYQNAYNAQMLNYQNAYNSPLQQMLRYQEAGLNPALIYGQQNVSADAAPGAAPKGGSIPVTSVQKATATINSIQQVIGAAQELFDYAKFGNPIRAQQLRQNESLATRYGAEADWALYWNYGEGMGPNSPYVGTSPRAIYMHDSTRYKEAQINQIKSLINTIYPAQEEQMKALSALNDYKKQILEGQNDAILQIHTGNDAADAILKALLFKLLNTNF